MIRLRRTAAGRRARAGGLVTAGLALLANIVLLATPVEANRDSAGQLPAGTTATSAAGSTAPTRTTESASDREPLRSATTLVAAIACTMLAVVAEVLASPSPVPPVAPRQWDAPLASVDLVNLTYPAGRDERP